MKLDAPELTPQRADYLARCLVNGSARHSKSDQIEPIDGAWSARFKSHPWVIQAEAEGWGRDLRQSCINSARQRIMARVKPNEIQPEDIMPKAEYVEHWREEVRKGREAYEWRLANPNHPSIKGAVEIDPVAYLRKLGITRPEPDHDPNTGEVK